MINISDIKFLPGDITRRQTVKRGKTIVSYSLSKNGALRILEKIAPSSIEFFLFGAETMTHRATVGCRIQALTGSIDAVASVTTAEFGDHDYRRFHIVQLAEMRALKVAMTMIASLTSDKMEAIIKEVGEGEGEGAGTELDDEPAQIGEAEKSEPTNFVSNEESNKLLDDILN